MPACASLAARPHSPHLVVDAVELLATLPLIKGVMQDRRCLSVLPWQIMPATITLYTVLVSSSSSSIQVLSYRWGRQAPPC